MKRKNKLIKIITIIIIIILLATYFIGNYFVNFALVPNQGGKNRKKVTEEIPDGVSKKDSKIEKIIKKNKNISAKSAEEFIHKERKNTKEISISSQDGFRLVGHKYLQENPTDKWMVIVHGYQSSENESNKLAYRFYSQGFNILTYNQRATKPSEGNYITMGIKESDDLILWIEEIKKEYPNAEFVLHGTSMGSATVLLASGKENLPKEVKAIIADCGYSSVWDIFSSELKQRFNLPPFPILHMAGLVAIPKAGINLMSDEGNVAEHVEKSTTPTLFIHGTADDFVPYPMVNKLYDALKIKEKDKFIVEGAGHAEAQYVDPDKYFGAIEEFLKGKI
ncbi:alpha/beta hydrolase [Helcococcus kunzii]|uniref:alpha/beta hydrolase n=1 Tax=Helcococcus kunzii TaxID=40091 RepID=UPI001BAF619A|nr:alpha/beta hydrolase [Helcococcus kunzii]QUY65373.1 alpha/beta hydrolase [Helcococcus kunzii]